MSVTLQKERLLKLADPLEADANNPTGVKFDLTVWAAPAAQQEAVEHHDYDAINAAKFREGTTEVPLDCNTAACAIGLACISGAFADQGLTWKIEHRNLYPIYEYYASFDAVGAFFGLNEHDVNTLFTADEYPPDERKGRVGELAVAKRIRALVSMSE